MPTPTHLFFTNHPYFDLIQELLISKSSTEIMSGVVEMEKDIDKGYRENTQELILELFMKTDQTLKKIKSQTKRHKF